MRLSENIGLNRADRSDMEYISPAGQRMPPPAITRHTHSLCSKWSDLRTWYCQCFISSPANWHFICIPASLKIEHLGETATGSPAVVTSHSGTSLTVCKQGLRPTEAPPPTLIRAYLAWMEKERSMPVTLVCQLAGPFCVDAQRLERRRGPRDELGETDEWGASSGIIP